MIFQYHIIISNIRFDFLLHCYLPWDVIEWNPVEINTSLVCIYLFIYYIYWRSCSVTVICTAQYIYSYIHKKRNVNSHFSTQYFRIAKTNKGQVFGIFLQKKDQILYVSMIFGQ
jgi:hypothetical protein